MSDLIPTAKRTRLDARLSETQRALFEKAAIIGGFRNFSHFVISSAQEKAEEIIRQKELVLASERDADVFFAAIMNPPAPNAALKNAFESYSTIVKSK